MIIKSRSREAPVFLLHFLLWQVDAPNRGRYNRTKAAFGKIYLKK